MAQSQRKLQVAFAAGEAAPFVKTGGLGDVAGSLPAELARSGAEVVVFVPKYDVIPQKYSDEMRHLCDFRVQLGWRNAYCGLEELDRDGVRWLFVDNEQYFKRGYPYGFYDDGERFAFFSKAIVESLQHIPGFECDVLHLNDWHTALAPVFLRECYQGIPLYEHVRTVFSIHNIAFQGQFAESMIDDVCGLGDSPAAVEQLRCGPGSMNCMRGALCYADAITTVSPNYAREIQTPAFGERLDGLLRRRSGDLRGIVNGLDTRAYDPAGDPRLVANYSAEDLSGKAACKAALQEEMGLEVDAGRPLAVVISRLTKQKGIDLLVYALQRILAGGVQVAVLGTGDADYEEALRGMAADWPGRMAARIDFDSALSQRMYSGADLLFMPSLFEPCGLSQLIAMRYGTLPVVRETGGLADTVAPYNQYTGEGTGFSFANFNGEEFGDAVMRAARLYWDEPEAWRALVVQAMSQDFGWSKSAGEYMELYRGLHPEPEEAASEGASEGGEAASEEAAEGGEAAGRRRGVLSERPLARERENSSGEDVTPASAPAPAPAKPKRRSTPRKRDAKGRFTK